MRSPATSHNLQHVDVATNKETNYTFCLAPQDKTGRRGGTGGKTSVSEKVSLHRERPLLSRSGIKLERLNQQTRT